MKSTGGWEGQHPERLGSCLRREELTAGLIAALDGVDERVLDADDLFLGHRLGVWVLVGEGDVAWSRNCSRDRVSLGWFDTTSRN